MSDFLQEVSCLLSGLVLGGSSVAALEPFGSNIIFPSAFLSSGRESLICTGSGEESGNS